MSQQTQGFITILTGMYSFQDCIHFLASVRKFHQEPIIILIDSVPKILYPLLKSFGNIILKPAPINENPVLASRLAKIALYEESPFEKSIFLDADICLLTNIKEIFEDLDKVDLLLTEDVQPDITKATNLLRTKQEPLPILQTVGLPLNENSIQYNSGLIAFKKSSKNADFFSAFKKYFDVVYKNQDLLLLRDQGAFAAAIATIKPEMKILPPNYNYLTQWKNLYNIEGEIKILHCTYPYRPQYAKDITRSLNTRIFDKIAQFFLPNQINNPWRTK